MLFLTLDLDFLVFLSLDLKFCAIWRCRSEVTIEGFETFFILKSEFIFGFKLRAKNSGVYSWYYKKAWVKILLNLESKWRSYEVVNIEIFVVIVSFFILFLRKIEKSTLWSNIFYVKVSQRINASTCGDSKKIFFLNKLNSDFYISLTSQQAATPAPYQH